MCYVRVQLYEYVTCGQVSVKRSHNMYETYRYVTSVHYMKFFGNDYCDRFVHACLTHGPTYKTNSLTSMYIEQTSMFNAIRNVH